MTTHDAFDTSDPRSIWVSPDNAEPTRAKSVKGIGTYEDPFTSMTDALKKVRAGGRIILLPGVYEDDLTIEISGEENSPIYITSYKTGEAIVDDACWYFYDACDLVVSGMTFKNAKRTALSVVGQCLRNRFHAIRFVDCGTDGGDTCTFYFGGAGGRFNIVEDCEFVRAACDVNIADDVNHTNNLNNISNNIVSNKNTNTALMISDGGDGDYLMNHVIRQNKFCGYDRAIIVGTGNYTEKFESGHIVERNIIDNNRADGITIKCRDAQVRYNVIKNCANAGIKLDGGGYSVVNENKIANCNTAIAAGGQGHTVTRNTIAACKNAVCPTDNHDGLIDDDNIVTTKLFDDMSTVNHINDDDNDDGYIGASMQDDVDLDDDVVDDDVINDDADNVDDHDDNDVNTNIINKKNINGNNDVDEIDILKYMFHLEER